MPQSLDHIQSRDARTPPQREFVYTALYVESKPWLDAVDDLSTHLCTPHRVIRSVGAELRSAVSLLFGFSESSFD